MAAPRRRGRPKKEQPASKSTPKSTLSPQGDIVFALDIGTRTVVGVLGRQENDIFKVIDTESVPHPKRAMRDGQVEDIDQVAKIANIVKNRLEQRNHLELTSVSVAAAGRALKTYRVSADFDISDKSTITADMVRTMEYAAIQKAQAGIDEKYAVQGGVFYCVGHSVVKYVLDDYKISSLEGHKGEKVTVELIAAFLPSVVVEGLYAVTDKIGLTVKCMTLEPIAAMNVIIPPEIRLINIALVDIGAGTSDIALAKEGAIIGYAMATVAGDEISEDIVRSFLVDFNMAESMKIQAGSGAENIVYKDIFGIEKTLTAAEFIEKCSPSVQQLADVISEAVTEANGGSPAAMFLIGGGSMANGLTDMLAQRLIIDEGRVAIGGQEFMKNVDTGDRKLGPEYVTPIGIAVTACTNQAYDFSNVKLNGEIIRIFDTKALTVFELLSAAGYKSSQIMGHSGAGLKYKFNGDTRFAKGSSFTPAVISVNGTPAALTTKIKQGDDVMLIPAINGENARVYVREIPEVTDLKSVSVIFCGENATAGRRVFANGKEVTPEYEIQPLDEIELRDTTTLAAFLRQYGDDIEGVEVFVNKRVTEGNYVLQNDDVITFYEADAIRLPQSDEAESDTEPEYSDEDDIAEDYDDFADDTADTADTTAPAASTDNNTNAATPDKSGYTTVIFNGEPEDLPPKDSGTPYMLIDLFSKANIDVERPASKLVLSINGMPARFTDKISDGDIVIIRQEEV